MTEKSKSGVLYGVGVGPGDPELVTLKALRVMRECDVLLLPAESKEKCMAYGIAVSSCPELRDKQTRTFRFPMTRDETELNAAYDAVYSQVRPMLCNGMSAVFLTVGDPSTYSTFSYIAELASLDGFRVETVSGVNSFSACAASLGIPLALREEAIHVFPGITDYDEALKLHGTKVFMKTGKNIRALKEALILAQERGKIRVFAVRDCGCETEESFEGAEAIPEDPHYMMTVIVKEA